MLLGAGITAASAIVLWGRPAAAAATLPASEFAELLAGTARVDLVGVAVAGPVDLGSVGRVVAPVRCRQCSFDALAAPDVVFEAIVDLSGSTVAGPVDLRAARFLGTSIWEGVTFDGTADFTDVRLDGPTSFSGARFRDQASFRRLASSAAVDARQSKFTRPAVLDGASVPRLDATFAEFAAGASFVRATIETLRARGARFVGPASFEGLRTERVDAAGAEFLGTVNLSGLTSSGPVILRGLVVTGTMRLDDFRAGSLQLDLDRLGRVAGRSTRHELLALLERTARDEGNLVLANQARYRLLAEQSRRRVGLHRLGDWLFYQQVGGYLVRPLYPLRTVLGLIAVGAAVRIARDRRAIAGAGCDRPRRARCGLGLLAGLDRLAWAGAAALRPTLRPRPAEAGASRRARTGRWAEHVAHKLLAAALLLSVANANPTLRQILDTVKG